VRERVRYNRGVGEVRERGGLRVFEGKIHEKDGGFFM
jgi:hypothetical protein